MADFPTPTDKYLAGLAQPEPPQARSGKDGDPQLASLHERLMDLKSSNSPATIVDIGSGAGVLTSVIRNVWANDTFPRYIAIDIKESLDDLAMPTEIHNNSAKICYSNFLENGISNTESKPFFIVIRNMFHELNIEETGKLLFSINHKFPNDTHIYIQDMEILPRAERGNAGWDQDIFEELLNDIGMSPQKYGLRSKSGIDWFACNARTTLQNKMKSSAYEQICFEKRQKMANIRQERLSSIQSTYDKATSDEYSIISHELTVIYAQLSEYKSNQKSEVFVREIELGAEKLHIMPSIGRQHYLATVDSEKISSELGLAAFLRSKDVIDFHEQISGANSIAWFYGYSNRPLFESPSNRDSIARSIENGVDFRVIVRDPESDIVKIRSKSSIYRSYDELKMEIIRTIESFKSILDHFSYERSQVTRAVELRVTDEIPLCSFFIIDNICIASLYTPHQRGEFSPSFVFRPAKNGAFGFYEFFLREFHVSWDNSKKIGAPV